MKDVKPLVSIITVSLNSVNTIEQTILSVINQTFKDYEYIIIDGGSTDGTLDIIKKYQDKISYFVSEKDNGIGNAFNKGILASRGKIIGIINSDDYYEENTLETIDDLDKKHNADFYIGALKYFENNNSKNYIIIYPDNKYNRKNYYLTPRLNHPASFFKKELYQEVGLYKENYKYIMDREFLKRVSLKNKVGVFTDRVLTNMSSGGVSERKEKMARRERLDLFENKVFGLFLYCIYLLKIKIKKIIIFLGGYKLFFLIKSILSKKIKKGQPKAKN